jgi:hypothetical protein
MFNSINPNFNTYHVQQPTTKPQKTNFKVTKENQPKQENAKVSFNGTGRINTTTLKKWLTNLSGMTNVTTENHDAIGNMYDITKGYIIHKSGYFTDKVINHSPSKSKVVTEGDGNYLVVDDGVKQRKIRIFEEKDATKAPIE